MFFGRKWQKDDFFPGKSAQVSSDIGVKGFYKRPLSRHALAFRGLWLKRPWTAWVPTSSAVRQPWSPPADGNWCNGSDRVCRFTLLKDHWKKHLVFYKENIMFYERSKDGGLLKVMKNPPGLYGWIIFCSILKHRFLEKHQVSGVSVFRCAEHAETQRNKMQKKSNERCPEPRSLGSNSLMGCT